MESLRADHVLNVIGVIGGSAISVSLLPQVIHTYKTKCTADISYSYQLIYIFGTALVNTYAIYYGYWAVYAPCLLEFILIVTLTIMKGIYDKRGVVADVVRRRDSATSSYHSRSMRRSSIIHAGTTSSTNRHGGSSGALALDILSDIQLSLSTLYQTEIDLDDEKTCADILEMAYSMEEGLKKVISDAAQAKKQTFTTED
mmetsp:Transcript_22754/g.33703  ORF Transcript_22754/g.33703 Transcript_22754/m.33703 type:complete len:200 (-) Transcript_22754:54-653(-)